MGIFEIQVKNHSRWIYSPHSTSGPVLSVWDVFTFSLFFPAEFGGIWVRGFIRAELALQS